MASQTSDNAKIALQENDDPLPEGYSEALKNCTALGANPLSLAINGENINRCWDCSSWIGRCTKGKIWRIARDEACSEFTPKQKIGEDNATKAAQ
jgi:hypothetical protein